MFFAKTKAKKNLNFFQKKFLKKIQLFPKKNFNFFKKFFSQIFLNQFIKRIMQKKRKKYKKMHFMQKNMNYANDANKGQLCKKNLFA